MTRLPKYLDTHTGELVRIWRAGWDISVQRTAAGVWFRLEKGLYFRGGRRTGWWWRPTTSQALRKLLQEAEANPRRNYPASTASDEEW